MFFGSTLHETFAERAARWPDRIALTCAGTELTYRELDRRATAVARALGPAGEPDRLVGLCVDRSADLVIGLLGILKAGAAYVPIDPAYPAERIRFLLADSGVRTVVAVPRVRAALTGALPADGSVQPLWLDGAATAAVGGAAAVANAAAVPTGTDLAYVIYTSGSSGTPKGVLVEHRNVLALIQAARTLFSLTEDDVWTLFHSVSFDFSVWEIWGALLTGGRLVVVPAEATGSAELLRALLRQQRVTVLSQTPSAFRQLTAAETARPAGGPADLALRLVIFGGERLDVKLLEPWVARYGLDRPQLVNMYGITETTVHVTHRTIGEAELARPGDSVIGGPLPGVTLELLDEAGRPVPDGRPGELYVGGTGVARGYHRQPELTAARFGQGPTGARRYRSGDRAMRGPDGDYVYLGRLDQQVQVRGFRVEPAEVEANLARHPDVVSVLVDADDFGDGDVRLIAYVVPPVRTAITEQLTRRLTAELAATAARQLPVHMRPSSYRFVQQLPVTAQGKVDRAALRSVDFRESPGTAGPDGAAGALTGTRQQVFDLVTEVLQRPGVGPADDLFELGATSLTFMRIVALVNQRLGVALTGAELDEATVDCLAACVDEQLSEQELRNG